MLTAVDNFIHILWPRASSTNLAPSQPGSLQWSSHWAHPTSRTGPNRRRSEPTRRMDFALEFPSEKWEFAGCVAIIITLFNNYIYTEMNMYVVNNLHSHVLQLGAVIRRVMCILFHIGPKWAGRWWELEPLRKSQCGHWLVADFILWSG